MAGIDVFSGDAFSTFELTSALDKVPFVPGSLGALGLFEEKPVRTETVAVERRNNRLAIIQTTPRGAPLPQATKDPRDLRDFRTVRVAKGDHLTASELQGIRAFGTTSELEQVQEEVMRRMTNLRRAGELTHENMRLGAVRGVVTDADGSVIRDWFQEWGISKPSIISFGLANEKAGIRATCNKIVRAVGKACGNSFTQQSGVRALVGDNFWDAFTTHAEVERTYLNWQAAAELRGGTAWGRFDFGGISWENYRGTDDGEVGISPNEVQFFPVNAGAFEVARSPGESFDWVNTPGLPWYALQVPDKDRNSYVDIELYSYPLYICSAPQALLRGKI